MNESAAGTATFSDRQIYAHAAGQSGYAGEQPKPRRALTDRLPLIAGWAGLVLLILAIGFSFIRFRQQIAELWPQSASLYRAFGQDVYTRGLEFKNVSYREMTQGGQAVLAVTGKLVNITSHEVPVPAIHVTLFDGDRRVLYNWSFSANVTTLRPGEAVSFVTRLSSPPTGARHLQLQLADSGG